MNRLLLLVVALSMSPALGAAAKKPTKAKPQPAEPAAAPAVAPVPAPAPSTPPISATPAPAPAPATPAPPAAPPPASEPGTLRLGVIDFQSPGELQLLASALAGYVANELQRLGAFQVITSDQLRAMLSVERQAQLLGCPDDSCRGQVTISLGFDDIVTGKLSRLQAGQGATFTLELVLIDQNQGKRTASDVVQSPSEAELLSRIPGSVTKLVGTLLRARSGNLVLATSEAGATVKVDDVIVGVTPVGQSSVAGGPHQVAVEKEGFVTWKKEVRVKPDEMTEETVKLVPSPDFISAYRSKQTKLRIGMIATAVVAAGALATGIAMGIRAQNIYGHSENDPGTFLYARAHILSGIESENGVDYRDLANRTKADITTSQAVAYLGYGLAGAAAVTSVVLGVLGENPNRYDVYQAKNVELKVGALITPNGGGASLGGSF
jgi:hypothetical protein